MTTSDVTSRDVTSGEVAAQFRADGRLYNAMRSCEITPNFISNALGSVLIRTGKTRVICTASVESKPPPWLRSGGWVTAEYAMLPASTNTRSRRDPGGRGKEIERLIGRALRSSVNLEAMAGPEGGLAITCDCDVIEADGGTRTAAITGGFVALRLAIKRLLQSGRLLRDPIIAPVSAVSVGLITGEAGEPAHAVLDLDYLEDSAAVVDFNVVMRGGALSGLVEVQGTGEQGVFSRSQLDDLLDLATIGCREHFVLQQAALAEAFA